MEKQLDRVMDEVLSQPGIAGCVLVDHQGLCLGSRGKASGDSAGVIAALVEQAAKLEPDNVAPVITLENDNKTCIVQRAGTMTAAIYKNKV